MATWQGACNGSTYLTTFYYQVFIWFFLVVPPFILFPLTPPYKFLFWICIFYPNSSFGVCLYSWYPLSWRWLLVLSENWSLIKLLDLGHIIYFIQLMFPFYNPFFNSNVMMIHQVFIQLHVPFYNSFFNSNVMIHQVFIQLMFLSTTLFLISKWWSTKFSYNSCSFLQTLFLISKSRWFTKLHIWFM